MKIVSKPSVDNGARPETAAPFSGETHRVQIRTLSLIRWAAIVGQLGTIAFVRYGLGFALPMTEVLVAVGASVAVNLVSQFAVGVRAIPERGVAAYLAFDILQLAVLLYLTGGLGNPFAFLLLAPVAVSATVLSRASTMALACLALAGISILSVWHLPLPWRGPPPAVPSLYVLGVWVALAVGIVFFAVYTWRVAEAARRLSDGLAATHLALAREQQLSAVGAIAAAAAHELGSPLGTIAIVAREMARDLPPDCQIADDVALLSSEAARCRDILAELAHNPAGDAVPFSRVPLSTVIESAAARHEQQGISVRIDAGPEDEALDSKEPHIASSPEIIHSIGNLVQNAVQFARNEVDVRIRWSHLDAAVVIADDGPGFPAQIIERVGEPYVSGRSSGQDHMGLGIFIARTLLSRTGGALNIRNRRQGGAEIEVRWDRAVLENAANYS